MNFLDKSEQLLRTLYNWVKSHTAEGNDSGSSDPNIRGHHRIMSDSNQASSPWYGAFQHCHRAQVETGSSKTGLVRVRGRRPVCIPAGTVKIVPTTCPQGVLISPAMVTLHRGTAYIPVLNVSTTDAMLHPRTAVGMLSPADIVSLPEGVTEVAGSPNGQVRAVVSSQVSTQPDPVEALDLSTLSPTEQDKFRCLLRQYSSVLL